MCVDRRDFLRLSAGLASATLFESEPLAQSRVTSGVTPISDDELFALIDAGRR